MNGADFLALLPLLTLTVGVVILLLTVSIHRNHRLIAWSTGGVFALALLACLFALDAAPRLILGFFRVDGYGLIFTALFAATAMFHVPTAYAYLERRKGEEGEYYLLLATATLGAMTMAVSDHFAAFLLGMEILSISLYPLIAYPEEGHAPLA